MGFERISPWFNAGTMIDSVPSHSRPGFSIFRSVCTTSAAAGGEAIDEQTQCNAIIFALNLSLTIGV